MRTHALHVNSIIQSFNDCCLYRKAGGADENIALHASLATALAELSRLRGVQKKLDTTTAQKDALKVEICTMKEARKKATIEAESLRRSAEDAQERLIELRE